MPHLDAGRARPIPAWAVAQGERATGQFGASDDLLQNRIRVSQADRPTGRHGGRADLEAAGGGSGTDRRPRVGAEDESNNRADPSPPEQAEDERSDSAHRYLMASSTACLGRCGYPSGSDERSITFDRNWPPLTTWVVGRRSSLR